jgi:predicted DNA-binding transcriptional regulator AlpA
MDKLLKTKEVADLFGLSPITLESWRTQDTGPKFIKVGRYVRYRQQDIENYLRRQTRGNTDTE